VFSSDSQSRAVPPFPQERSQCVARLASAISFGLLSEASAMDPRADTWLLSSHGGDLGGQAVDKGGIEVPESMHQTVDRRSGALLTFLLGGDILILTSLRCVLRSGG
jgi:hypothetical protein